MNSFKSYLKKYITKYPQSTTSDYLKLIFQSEYGVEHLIENVDSALSYLNKEINISNNHNDFLYEYISNEYLRINLSSFKKSGFLLEELNAMFIETSHIKANSFNLHEKISILQEFIGKCNEIDSFKINPYPLHHSEKFRLHYCPHYRVIHKSLLTVKYRAFMLDDYLLKLSSTLHDNQLYFIALEGKCCSGKTTITKNIKNATIIHADDFFSKGTDPLDFDSIKNVLTGLKLEQVNKYKIYNCMTNTYEDKQIDDLKQIVILEGVFSYHQKIRSLFNEVIYIADALNQIERLKNRCANNEQLYNKFISTWIPREEKYYQSFDFIYHSSIII